MKKKFLNLLFTPLLVTPIIASSCADTNNIAAQSFTYDSNKYQLYIIPIAGDANDYKTANILIRLKYTKDPNHKEGAQDNQYIGDITINGSYTNPDNGYSYKTNNVSFDVLPNNKVKYTTGETDDKSKNNYYVNYTISSLSVTSNEFSSSPSWYDWTTTSYSVVPNINANKLYMDVGSFKSTIIVANSLNFSNKLFKLDKFVNWVREKKGVINMKLPNSLKIIGRDCFWLDCFSQTEFVIPESVEEIGNSAFLGVKFIDSSSSSDSNSNQLSSAKNNKIKVPKKFESQEKDIFGSKEIYQSDYTIEYY